MVKTFLQKPVGGRSDTILRDAAGVRLTTDNHQVSRDRKKEASHSPLREAVQRPLSLSGTVFVGLQTTALSRLDHSIIGTFGLSTGTQPLPVGLT